MNKILVNLNITRYRGYKIVEISRRAIAKKKAIQKKCLDKTVSFAILGRAIAIHEAIEESPIWLL